MLTRSRLSRMKARVGEAGEDPPLCRMGCGHYGMPSALYMCSVCSRLAVGQTGAPVAEPLTALQLYEATLHRAGVHQATTGQTALLKAACRSALDSQRTRHAMSIEEIHQLLTATYRDLAEACGHLFLIPERDGVEMMHLLTSLREAFDWYKLSHLVGRLVYMPWVALRDMAFHSSTLCYHGNMGDTFFDHSVALRLAVDNPASVYKGTPGYGDGMSV